MARFSGNWVTIQDKREEYLENIRCQKVTPKAQNDTIDKTKMEEIIANNGVMRAEMKKLSDRLKKNNESEIIHEGQIAQPEPPKKRKCKPEDNEERERKRVKYNAMERKRRLEQNMAFEMAKLTCPHLYGKKFSHHDILRGLKHTLSMTSTYFYKKVVLTLEQQGFRKLEYSKLKKICKLTKTQVRSSSQ
ncbi:hypothetical protein TKK_0012699 [Trichogramma kaykai]|uniref:BHLH domain-containing protein n=1 Tax=Trichogramma kaykai TaxID=54128 RepID=A0ABD2WKF4_9HYME